MPRPSSSDTSPSHALESVNEAVAAVAASLVPWDRLCLALRAMGEYGTTEPKPSTATTDARASRGTRRSEAVNPANGSSDRSSLEDDTFLAATGTSRLGLAPSTWAAVDFGDPEAQPSPLVSWGI